jgi:hypothetical protein
MHRLILGNKRESMDEQKRMIMAFSAILNWQSFAY